MLLVGAEASVRALAPVLPTPLEWPSWEMQNKVREMDGLAADGVRADVVFLGSSSVNNGIDPSLIQRELGVRGFNAAINGADLRVTDWWARNVVLPKLRPRAVVIGMTSYELEDNFGIPGGLYEKVRDSAAGRRVAGRGPGRKLQSFFEQRSALIRYRAVLRQPVSALRGSDAAQAGDSVRSDGVLRRVLLLRPGAYWSPNTPGNLAGWRRTHGVYEIGGRQTRAFTRLVHALRASSVHVTVVLMPVTRDAVFLHPRGRLDYQAFVRTVERLVESQKLDFVRVSTARTGHFGFRDPFHLNRYGMRYLSSALAGEALVTADRPPLRVEVPALAAPTPSGA